MRQKSAMLTMLSSLSLLLPGLAAAQTPDEMDSRTTKRADTGHRDFDFIAGEWRCRHRKLKARLVGSQEWAEFGGTTSGQTLLGGYANLDDNVLDDPAGSYRAASLRSYDAKTRQWSIWWLDSRFPQGPLEPAVRGGFHDGVGTFYADDTYDGKPIRVRFIWSGITASHAHWEQAFSADGGKTWETNWTMDFERIR